MKLDVLTPPEIITAEHLIEEFESGEKTLDDWLKQRALKNSIAGASRCPLPALLLGRLAVGRKFHNQGLGSALLRDAMLRCFSIARNAAVFVILVHALHERAKQFYVSRGFVESPLQDMTLMMTMATLEEILEEPD